MPNASVPKNYVSRLVATQPSIPSSTVALANPTGYDCVVYIYGGTVTVISINGTQVGSTGPACLFVGAGDSVSLTYSAAPTAVQWFYASNVE